MKKPPSKKPTSANAANLDFLMQISPDAILLSDNQGKIRGINQLLCSMFGYEKDQLLGESFEILIPKSLRTSHKEKFDRYVDKPQARNMGSRTNLLGLHKSGKQIPLDIKLNHIKLAGQVHYISTIRDMTLYLETLDQLKESNDGLRIANQSYNEVLGMAAHDLRNPLTAIIGFVDLLEDGLSDQPEHAELFKYIQSSLKFMTGLVEEILDYSRFHSTQVKIKPQMHALGTLLEICIHMNQKIALKKKTEIRVLKSEQTMVWCDFNKIEQVMNNIISNAIKYSPPESIIEIKLCKTDDDKIQFECFNPGEGIREEDYDLVFEPFKTTRTKTTAEEASTGLGLAICKKIIDSHKGQLWFESKYNQGIKFCFYLPLVRNSNSNQSS